MEILVKNSLQKAIWRVFSPLYDINLIKGVKTSPYRFPERKNGYLKGRLNTKKFDSSNYAG